MFKQSKIIFVVIVSNFYCAIVNAEFSLFESNELKLTGSVEASAAYFQTGNTNFGAGRIDFFTGENTGDAYSFKAI